ncbi:uncharacterized protein KIAA2026-like isoform X2 [Myzus persicae]|uniref:uncharacterized protein KIAA2026-like isoform X2 n=1 Tax=Myzus persicae TaxID=13164 RepID=UPI000B9309EB|nr:uncharacterized protein KIAA2026-like isoform X2 [Myzus persicae]
MNVSKSIKNIENKEVSEIYKNYKLLADVNLTFSLLNMEGKPSSKLRCPKDCYDSVLLQSDAQCHPQRLKQYHKKLSTTLITDKDNAQILEKISIWENKVNFNEVFHQYISSMWELPEIGNFVAILFKKLDLDIVNQGEIENMFLMPKESTTMAKIMTTLLMPVKKTKSIDQVMPYKVWSEKLSKKVSDWCKVYHTKKQNKVIVMNSLGIHPDFWLVVNEKNPLIEKDYSELSYFIKVWLVKGLCDYVTIKFKTINDIITNCNERQCTIWKNDLETEEYFFFNSMPDLRIYYYNIPYDEPCLEFLESVKTVKQVVQFEDNLTLNRFSKDSHTVPKKNIFKLIADSVEGLRSFVRELDLKGTSVPENLISSLENLIVKIELEENNYIAMNNDSKIKLFKDWVSYPGRIQKNKDNMSRWAEKDLKAIVQAKNEELIIVEKRQRKLRVHQNFDIFYSDEYVSENDKFLSDFTDSEDEWGAMNQPKNKVKQPQQTPSKAFLELEKRALEAEKMLKYSTNQNDEKQLRDEVRSVKHSTNEVCKTNMKNKSIKSVKLLKTQNEVKSGDATNTIVNSHNQVKQLQHTPSKCIKLEKQLREEDTTLIKGSNKMFKTNKIDKSIKSVKLLKTQNEVKSGDTTNTIVNSHYQVNQLQHTPSKYIKLEKRSREEDTYLLHGPNKMFKTNRIDKSIKSVKLLKTQNEVKSGNTTNTFVNVDKQRLVRTKNKDNVCSYDEVVLIDSDKEENQKSPGGVSQVEVITLDEDMQNDCEVFDGNFKSLISNRIDNKNRKTNEQNNKYTKRTESAVIPIKDDDQIIIIDHKNDVQLLSMTGKPVCSPLKTSKPLSLKTNSNKSYNSVSVNRQITPTNYFKVQETSSMIHKLSQNVTIMPANVNIPKGIVVTMVKTPQIDSNFHSNKFKSTTSNGHLPNNSSTINVKCELISKPNVNEEVKFYVKLPNGTERPISNEIINQYLKQHNNQLPDFWLVPLAAEDVKQYGVN